VLWARLSSGGIETLPAVELKYGMGSFVTVLVFALLGYREHQQPYACAFMVAFFSIIFAQGIMYVISGQVFLETLIIDVFLYPILIFVGVKIGVTIRNRSKESV
jgi:hypothetical protein